MSKLKFLHGSQLGLRTILVLSVIIVAPSVGELQLSDSQEEIIQESVRGVEYLYQSYGSQHSVDLVFVLDRSGSIPAQGWESIMTFVYSILEHFTVDASNTRVAIVTFSTYAHVDVNDLTETRENKCSLMQRLRQRVERKTMSGYTATYAALNTAYKLLLNSRADAKKAVIVLTDGYSNIGPPPVYASVDIRSLRWSEDWDADLYGPQVEIFAYGVHKAHWGELKSIATPLANHTYFLPKFREYREMARLLHQDKQSESWEVTGRLGSCTDSCSVHAVCTCATRTGQYTCLCTEGYEGDGYTCTACPIGRYKDSMYPGRCLSCPGNLTTLSSGSRSVEQCVCEPPYYLDGDAASALCQRTSCSELPPIPHGHTFHVWGSSQSELPDTGVQCENTPDDSCHYVCDPGYRLHGLPALVCSLNGTWIAEVPVCNVVDCTSLQQQGESDPHAVIQYLNQTTTYGSLVTVACQPGWQLFGDALRVCAAHGLWSGVPMKCIEALCPVLPSVVGGELTPSSCSQSRQSPSTMCMFSCDDGYQLIGPAMKICGYHGNWDNDTLSQCIDIDPPEISCPGDIRVPATAGNSTIVYWDHEQPSVNDNSGHVKVTKVGPFRANQPANVLVGFHQIKYIATDRTGNSAICMRSIQVFEKLVSVSQCPSNITFMSVQGLGQTVNWTEPVFSDHDDIVLSHECSKTSGSYFTIGSQWVTCHPKGRYDPTCTFVVNLQRAKCDRPPAPHNGVLSCSTTASFILICSVHCNTRYDFNRPPLNFYHCDVKGLWNGKTLGADRKLWPDCSRYHLPGRAIMQGQFEYYYISGKCTEVKDIITRSFWRKIATHATAFCTTANCRVMEVEVECGEEVSPSRGRPRSRRDTSQGHTAHPDMERQSSGETTLAANSTATDSVLDFNTTAGPLTLTTSDYWTYSASLMNANNNSEAVKIFFKIEGILPGATENLTEVDQVNLIYDLQDLKFELEHELRTNSSALDIRVNDTVLQVKNTSHLEDPTLSSDCAPGQVVNTVSAYSLQCVNCPVGTYHSRNGTESCLPCPIGEFQDQEGQLLCQICPIDMTTKDQGSRDVSECRRSCVMGHWSLSGLEPCDPCDHGFYQDETGWNQCWPCPEGESTSQVGADDLSDCTSLCLPGSFNSTTGLAPCDLCPLDSYQPFSGSYGCLACPDNTGTTSSGSNSDMLCHAVDYCSNLSMPPCENGGECVSTGVNGFVCICPAGFTGLQCEEEIDECASRPCLNNATCEQSEPMEFSCVCPHGYTGQLCESEEDECSLTPCQNGGSCQDLLGGFRCYCLLGWSGDRCQTAVDECRSDPCLHGDCQDLENGYVCRCQPGYVGETCSIEWSACMSRPCRNEGRCRDWDRGGFTCDCPLGFLGTACEMEVNECRSEPCHHGGTCLDEVNGYSCQCPSGYLGYSCQTAVSPDFDLVFKDTQTQDYVILTGQINVPDLIQFSVCFWLRTGDGKNFGTVLSYLAENGDHRNVTSSSSSGFALVDYGRLKFVVNDAEADTGIQLNTGMWNHVCTAWESLNGQWSVYVNGSLVNMGMDLASGTVVQGQGHLVIGQNQQVWGGAFNSRESFIGELSQMNIHDHLLSDDVIGELANLDQCTTETYGNVLGWTHVSIGLRGHVIVRNQSACLDINECLFPAIYPCAPRHQCRDYRGGFDCEECIYGYEGPLCDQPINECRPNPCQNNGTCSDGPGVYDSRCTCSVGYTGSNCEEMIDYCDPEPCLNNGTCRPKLGGYTCNCQGSDKGDNCEDISGQCANSPCQNGGICVQTQNGAASCICLPRYGGDMCEMNTNPCSNNPCSNGGICEASEGDFICDCPRHFKGKTCSIAYSPSCELSPCLNNGTCSPSVNSVRGFECVCPINLLVEWDPFCGIRGPCESVPCQNDGVCVHYPNNTYECSCPPGYSGRLCEILQSISTPQSVTSFTSLSGGSIEMTFTMPATLTRDWCDGVECFHGGKCFDFTAGFVCQCPEDYKGKFCAEERRKELNLYTSTVRIITVSKSIYIDNKSFKKDFKKQVLELYAGKPKEGKLDARVMDIREFDEGVEVRFELAYTRYRDNAHPGHVLTETGVRTTLENAVTMGRLGPYILSRHHFKFDGKYQAEEGPSLTVYLSAGLAAGILLIIALVVWMGCRFRRDRSPPLSILNNTHEMVILNPIGNPAYQSDVDLARASFGRGGGSFVDENPYAELCDVAVPYAITPRSDLKEALLRRQHSSKRSKESNIELAAAMKASQADGQGKTSAKGDNPVGATCPPEDDYLQPVTLPRNEFSKGCLTKTDDAQKVNKFGETGGYLHPASLERHADTFPQRSAYSRREVAVEERRGLHQRPSSSGQEKPPDYLEVCPPQPEDFEERVPHSDRYPGQRELPPLPPPPIPMDEDV